MINILVAEDMDTNFEIISRILNMNGFKVTRAKNGEEAIELAKQCSPGLILMDMGMPIVNGWEATQIIKQIDELKHIPIIALTAHTMKSEVEKAMAAGCNDYESKPIVDFTKLVSKINSHLPG